jgi:hypothetical protein
MNLTAFCILFEFFIQSAMNQWFPPLFDVQFMLMNAEVTSVYLLGASWCIFTEVPATMPLMFSIHPFLYLDVGYHCGNFCFPVDCE